MRGRIIFAGLSVGTLVALALGGAAQEAGTRAAPSDSTELAAVVPPRPALDSEPDSVLVEDEALLSDDPGSPWAEPEADSAAAQREAADCLIAPYEVVDIKSTVRGRIEELAVERGDRVEADGVLVTLDSKAERAAAEFARTRAEMESLLRSREASLALGERRGKRKERLYEQNTIPLEALDEAETEVTLARQQLRQAHDERRLASLDHERALAVLDQRTIRSPISGVVVERFLAKGEVVDEEPILRIAQLDPLRVEVILPATLFGSLHPGMRARIRPEAPGKGEHEAAVEVVDRVIDPASETFGVRLRLPNPGYAIPSGLNCEVSFAAP